ncbi:hypothetical protein CLAFUR0_02650 [Fulvia fulva]|nr:hypothetical protein CLAFUR0_02650 [Fulvia fulva]
MASTANTPSNTPSPNPFESRQAHEANLSGTTLFDYVRARFCEGIVTLDSVLSFMALGHCRPGSIAQRQDIDGLLDNLIAMARWLVNFLQTATACFHDSPWTRSAIVGLRVELHQYSHKVMQISSIMQSVKTFRSEGDKAGVKPDEARVVDVRPKKKVLELEMFPPLGIRPEDIRLPDDASGEV